MAVDPVCHMNVDEATAIHTERGGETFYFCSDHCRIKFLAGSEAGVAGSENPVEAGHACCGDSELTDEHRAQENPSDTGRSTFGASICIFPMRPVVEQQGPGGVPDLRHGSGKSPTVMCCWCVPVTRFPWMAWSSMATVQLTSP